VGILATAKYHSSAGNAFGCAERRFLPQRYERA